MEIRLAEAADAAGILEIYGPVVERTAISFETDVPSVHEIEERIAAVTESLPWLCAVDDAGLLGYAYASVLRKRAAYQWSVEVSAYVHKRARRLGVGRKLYAALFAVLRELGYYRAYAGATLPNDASVAFHHSLGFTDVGVYHRIGHKFGQWHDVGWFELALRELDDAPMPPRSVHDLDAAAWERCLRA